MKGKRQKRILELVTHESIRTQDELTAMLQGEGIHVTQATVSRDIKELRLLKVSRGDGYVYSLSKGQMSMPDESRLRRIFRDAVLRMDASENLVMIHTLPGNANSVCFMLDSAEWEEILGAVAGDDTILIVAKSRDHVEKLMERLQNLLD